MKVLNRFKKNIICASALFVLQAYGRVPEPVRNNVQNPLSAPLEVSKSTLERRPQSERPVSGAYGFFEEDEAQSNVGLVRSNQRDSGMQPKLNMPEDAFSNEEKIYNELLQTNKENSSKTEAMLRKASIKDFDESAIILMKSKADRGLLDKELVDGIATRFEALGERPAVPPKPVGLTPSGMPGTTNPVKGSNSVIQGMQQKLERPAVPPKPVGLKPSGMPGTTNPAKGSNSVIQGMQQKLERPAVPQKPVGLKPSGMPGTTNSAKGSNSNVAKATEQGLETFRPLTMRRESTISGVESAPEARNSRRDSGSYGFDDEVVSPGATATLQRQGGTLQGKRQGPPVAPRPAKISEKPYTDADVLNKDLTAYQSNPTPVVRLQLEKNLNETKNISITPDELNIMNNLAKKGQLDVPLVNSYNSMTGRASVEQQMVKTSVRVINDHRVQQGSNLADIAKLYAEQPKSKPASTQSFATTQPVQKSAATGSPVSFADQIAKQAGNLKSTGQVPKQSVASNTLLQREFLKQIEQGVDLKPVDQNAQKNTNFNDAIQNFNKNTLKPVVIRPATAEQPKTSFTLSKEQEVLKDLKQRLKIEKESDWKDTDEIAALEKEIAEQQKVVDQLTKLTKGN